ncbi:MAG: glycosyltransferase family 2 protein [Bacteroidaceae bacterium]|nr:glycosyltransferase family 2 protein [Bacteroidaceae bacterium]
MEQVKEYPRFTVIIPQKNRAEYIGHTLKTCMIQEYPNFEVIVSDDCSEDNSVEVVEELAKKDPRIKLFAHKKHLGMRDNFEFALNQVQPGYVMALGGDDGLVPGCITRMYELIQETGKELLTWPSNFFFYPNNENGKSKFVINKRTNYQTKILKSTDYLNKISRSLNYMTEDCPMFYIKGVASTELVNRVKSRTSDGCFYYCPTPDGFSGVVLAGEVEDYAYVTEPLSITGISPKSQGTAYKKTDEKSRKEAQEFFNDNIRRTMHKELASQQYSPLVVLMTADYLLTARDLPGWPGKFDMFSFEDLIRACFKMLERNPFESEVLVRELKIIREIAIQHNCLELFEELMRTTKRKLVKEDLFTGSVITPNSVMFDGAAMGINNIYDASLALPFAVKFCTKFSAGAMWRVVKRVIKAVRTSKKYHIEYLPKID